MLKQKKKWQRRALLIESESKNWHFHFLTLIIWASPNQSNRDCLIWFKLNSRHAIRANVNKPSDRSDANVCRTLCHDIAFIPQLMHGKQIGNRKQTYWKNKVHWVKPAIALFYCTDYSLPVIAYCQAFDINMRSVVESQRRCHAKIPSSYMR